MRMGRVVPIVSSVDGSADDQEIYIHMHALPEPITVAYGAVKELVPRLYDVKAMRWEE
ncbi:MAG: hypothetical protein M1826_000438, partial [Phylliscum demangeonii]